MSIQLGDRLNPIRVLGDGISGSQRITNYMNNVLAAADGNVIILHPLNEESGTEALDYSGNDYHADYAGASLTVGGSDGIVAGTKSPLFGGTANGIGTWPAAFYNLATGVKGKLGHMSMWIKSSAWTDTTQRRLYRMFYTGDGLNYINIQKSTADNTISFQYEVGGLSNILYTTDVDVASVKNGWFNIQFSWSDSDNAGQARIYVNGAEQGTPTTVAYAHAGTGLNSAATALGAAVPDGSISPWSGTMALVFTADQPQGAASIAVLATHP